MSIEARYVVGGFMYGFARTFWHIQGTQTYDYDMKFNKIPRSPLVTEKCVVATLNGIMGMGCSPFFIYEDMCLFEKNLRNIHVVNHVQTIFFWTFYKK